MAEIWIDIDDEVLAEAAEVFATMSPSDTVNAALTWVGNERQRSHASGSIIDVDGRRMPQPPVSDGS